MRRFLPRRQQTPLALITLGCLAVAACSGFERPVSAPAADSGVAVDGQRDGGPESGNADPDGRDQARQDDAPAAGSSGGGIGDGASSPCASTERVRQDVAIPTLDGHALSAFVDLPAGEPCPLPTILIQTPYDKEAAYDSMFGAERPDRPLFASPDYNFVVVDWRGRFGSSDVPIGDGTWNAQDGYTNVEWIADQPWSDGQVAMWGVSALCGQQYRTAAGPTPSPAHPDFADGPPPSLRAMVPIMCPIRADYQRTYPGGVLRHEWASGLDVLGFGARSIYENNPRNNLLWSIVGSGVPIERVAVPALVVGGWWDVVPSDTVAAFQELVDRSRPEVRDQHRLLIGPWVHFAVGSEISTGAARPLTEEELAYIDHERRIDRDVLAFFDHHLRQVDNEVPQWPAVRYFQSGEGWERADAWPPADSVTTSFYAGAGRSLDTAPPPTGSTVDVPYDADDPSPTIGGATLSPYNCLQSAKPLQCILVPEPDTILLHGPTSQAAVVSRSDSVMFATAPAPTALQLSGDATVHVDVSTTLADADVAVRVVDIGPDGSPLLIGEGIARISSWADAAAWEPVAPGTRTSVEIPLNAPLGYTIPAGHQLGLILTGSNWPLYARNPGTGAVFHQDDVSPRTKSEFSWGLPARTIDLQSPGASGTLTFHLDGATRLEVGVAR